MKKESLGLLVILGGVAIIGFIWFKRNKPQIAQSQLAKLNAQYNNLATSADTIDKPFEYSDDVINNSGINPNSSGGMFSNLTPAQVKDLGNAVNQACPSCANLDFSANITNQIAQNMQNANLDFSHLGDLSKIDLTNIKIK
jgi:hypothetical protein